MALVGGGGGVEEGIQEGFHVAFEFSLSQSLGQEREAFVHRGPESVSLGEVVQLTQLDQEGEERDS